ncbi:MAG: hypothetical protein OEQ29_20725 [Alphaproteobacteria bacterium]|nr:hypothetical protein [Alphaproteobacteria bacterium]
MKRFLAMVPAIGIAAGLWLAATGLAAAQDISIRAFKGTWGGSAVANNRDSLYFGVTIRDLDVTITPSAEGFQIGWTTVIRRGGTPNKPKLRKKSVEMRFVNTGRKGVWKLANSGDMLSGNPYGWARIQGRTLTLYVMAIDERGGYAISRYARTLSGTGMDLEFTAIRDGEPARIVRGKLVRNR